MFLLSFSQLLNEEKNPLILLFFIFNLIIPLTVILVFHLAFSWQFQLFKAYYEGKSLRKTCHFKTGRWYIWAKLFAVPDLLRLMCQNLTPLLLSLNLRTSRPYQYHHIFTVTGMIISDSPIPMYHKNIDSTWYSSVTSFETTYSLFHRLHISTCPKTYKKVRLACLRRLARDSSTMAEIIHKTKLFTFH